MNINPQSHKAYKLIHDGILALARAEMQGFHVDMEYVEKKLKSLEKKQDLLEAEFKKTKFYKEWTNSSSISVNIYSPTQLGAFLYDVKGIKPVKYTKGNKGSTDEESLLQLNIPELDFYKQKTKIKKSMDVLKGFAREQVDGIIHPFYNLHLVRTFRSSSSEPNFQNIPKRDEEMMKICRRALYPRYGHQLLEVDFSGLEVRIAAAYHKDERMLAYINDPKSDMHADMAKQIFKIDKFDKNIPGHNTLRQAAKNGFVFPEFYGDYYKNCAENMACGWGKLSKGRWKPGEGIIIDEIGKPFKPYHLSTHLISKGIKSLDAFTEHIKEVEYDFWNNRFKQYQWWKDTHYEVYKKYGYVDLKTGFRCSGVMSKNDVINYPIQGSGFHCLLWSLIEMDRIIFSENLDTRILGQIHDSMILDVHPDELEYVSKTIHRITCEDLRNHWDWIIVPLEVDAELCPVDMPWTEKAKYKLV
jgi:DNA polymerase-1